MCEDAPHSPVADGVEEEAIGCLSLGSGQAKCESMKTQYLQVTDDVSRVTWMSLKNVVLSEK